MKKNLSAIFISTLLVLLSSCQWPFLTAPQGKIPSDRCVLSVTSQARTILPGKIEESGFTGFVLTGQSGTDDPVTFGTWETFTDLAADSEIYCAPGYWTFTLTARCEDHIYTGTISDIHIVSGKNTLNFIMTTTGPGSLAVTLLFPRNKGVAAAKATLYDGDFEEMDDYPARFLDITPGETQDSVLYAIDSINPGNYIVRFSFYRDVQATDLITPEYYENIIIESAKTSTAERTLHNLDGKYTITYHNVLESDTWSTGYPDYFKKLEEFNDKQTVSLPNKPGDLQSREDGAIVFCGFYLDEACTIKTEGWNPGEMNENVNLYASWKYDVAKLADYISDLEDGGTYSFSVCGQPQFSTYGNIKTAMSGHENSRFDLDLSEVNGRNSFEGFSDCTTLESIIIPKNVNYLNSATFYGCTNLTRCVLPEAITSIPANAFSGCTSLTDCTFPPDLESIGYNAFKNCSSLTTLDFSGTKLASIGDSAFSFCKYLTAADLSGTTVDTISESTFAYCSSLQTVHLPDTLTDIKKEAFRCCSALTDVNLPASLTAIGSLAFSECLKLTQVILPETESTLTIADRAFSSCLGLTTVHISQNTVLGKGAFRACSKLSSLSFTEGVTAIGKEAFDSCTALRTLHLPDSLITIGESAFANCSGLSEIVLPENLTILAETAFFSCTGAKKLVIPASVTKVGYRAFDFCTFETVLFKGTTPPKFDGGDTRPVGYDDDNLKIIVPKGTASTYKSALYWNFYKDNVVEAES